MEVILTSGASPQRLGIFPGSFNPPTVAHCELANSASAHVDELLYVLPRVFPHKDYSGATLNQRLEMLAQLNPGTPYSIAVSQSGLFIDIARECRAHYGARPQLYIICGTDCAQRILNWDYGRAGVLEEMLEEFELLVAPRGTQPRNSEISACPPHYRARIHRLPVSGNFRDVSSSAVRDRIKSGRAWEHLVPAEIVDSVKQIY